MEDAAGARSRTVWAAPLAVAAAIRVAMLLPVLSDPGRALVTDSPAFLEIARILRTEGRFDHLLRVPGYFAWVAGVQTVFGDDPRVLACLQTLLDLGSTILVAAAGAALAGPAAGRAAGLLFALNPLTPLLATRVLVESLAVFGMAGTAWAVARGSTTVSGGGRVRWLAAAGVSLGLAAYVRAIALYVPWAILPAWVALPGGRRERLRAAGAFLLPFLAVVFPWYARNAARYGAWTFTTLGTTNVLMGYAAAAVSAREGITYEQAQVRMLGELEQAGLVPRGEETHPWGRVVERHVHDDPRGASEAARIGRRILAQDPAAYARVHLQMVALLPLRVVHPGLGDLDQHFRPSSERHRPDLVGDAGSPTHLLKQGRVREALRALASRVGGPGEARLWFSLAGFTTSALLCTGLALAIPSAGADGPGARAATWALLAASAFLLLTPIPMGATRYFAPAVPLACAAAGAGWARGFRAWRGRRDRLKPPPGEAEPRVGTRPGPA